MLAIADSANSCHVPGLDTDFLVASIELIDTQTLRIWFTRDVHSGDGTDTNPNNYGITGPSPIHVILAQAPNDPQGQMSVNLYLSSPLTVGQWTIGFISGPPTGIHSNDTDNLALPTGCKIVFDLVDNSSNGDIGTNLVEGLASKFIPKEFRDKTVYSAILAGIETGDDIVSEQARLSFDQYFLGTARGKYLNTRAGDRGVIKPENLGISDSAFSKLAISVTNNKLLNDAMLSVLEIMYGPDSVRAYVETANQEPFEISDGGYLDLLVDEKTSYHFVANWSDFENGLRCSAQEIATLLNLDLDNNGVPAEAAAEHGKVRIYSKTKGVGSTVSIAGGTLQPLLQFDSPFLAGVANASHTFTLTNPRSGVVRFATSDFFNSSPLGGLINVHVGDYLTITGTEYPVQLRGSFPIIVVDVSYDSSNVFHSYVEIESSYLVP